ncbi:GNAT family N-acetyltransferase [Halorubrum vacuolatum]|uniref:Acetyltransferase (GNAT) family protein n=1 Tax=Halorubrum vacuolatum TaxID=63740 RepID=A0A238X1K3_HALVU|nr:GNAT family N-acetyltransferase [Halorubrum vacuolatum]SNR52468.1 Acetyltransferase (GNAT) family protein [Halorubrum vacuolatum]
MSPRRFPEDVADDFPSPPMTFDDRSGRAVEVRAYDGSEPEHEALVAMYTSFDPADRAQGIPPGGESRVRDWLEAILDEDCFNVLAWCDGEVAGHATLVPDGDGESYELAIFVHQDYQEAGIGTRLIRGLLGYGQRHDIEKVWLTVERWNHPAVSLYKKIGFETSNAESFEMEMSLRLCASEDDE